MKKYLFLGLGVLLAGAGLWWWFSKRGIGSSNPRLVPTGLPGTKRGELNNNPCNIEPLDTGTWQGQTGTDGTYCTFNTPTNGIRAAGVNALSYYLNDGRTTLAAFSVWGPGDPSYGEDLAATLGVPSSVNFDVPNNLENLLKAICINENSEVPYTEQEWQAGVLQAKQQKGLA